MTERDLSRRSFLELAGAAAAAAAVLPALGCAGLPRRQVVSGRVRHAGIGVGGMGWSDLEHIMSHPDVDVVALCDVDRNHLQKAAELAPGARLYRDWRELLEQEHDAIDSVHVTVPDHMHAPIMVDALRRGKHVYGQKPLTRTVHEARIVAHAARRAGVATQMGIQNRSNTPYLQALELFRQGHIGQVHEVHVWTDRPAGWWPQGMDRPAGSDPVPGHLDWDLWLGVAPERPYKAKTYHPFAWRGFRDFGTGAQGDMACHLMDPALWFLDLGLPTRVRSDGPVPNAESYPDWSTVHYEFPATPHTTRGPLLLTWYDGKRRPRQLLDELAAGEKVYANACLFVGTQGALLASPYEPPRLLPEERFADVPLPEVEPVEHWHQWVDAVLGRGDATGPFRYAANLTEVALLGNVALCHPHQTLRYDSGRMLFDGNATANALLRADYREGWGMRGLG